MHSRCAVQKALTASVEFIPEEGGSGPGVEASRNVWPAIEAQGQREAGQASREARQISLSLRPFVRPFPYKLEGSASTSPARQWILPFDITPRSIGEPWPQGHDVGKNGPLRRVV